MNEQPSRMKKSSVITASAAVIGVFGVAAACAGARIYTSSEFGSARQSHRTLAILPYHVTIEAKQLPKDMTPETVRGLERDEGRLFQRQLYTEFLQRQNRGEYSVQFQDIDRTNTLLERAGFLPDSMDRHTKDEIAD